MTDPLMDEVYALADQAIRQGQDHIQVQIFPFRMTDTNLARHANSQ
jgi:murein L,D-transpeptidase YafK